MASIWEGKNDETKTKTTEKSKKTTQHSGEPVGYRKGTDVSTSHNVPERLYTGAIYWSYFPLAVVNGKRIKHELKRITMMSKKQQQVIEKLGENGRSVALAWTEGLPHTLPDGLDEETAVAFRQVDPGFIAQASRRKRVWDAPFGTRPIT